MFPFLLVPFFRLRDNYVHVDECSPFWVGTFIMFSKENYHVVWSAKGEAYSRRFVRPSGT